MEYIWWQGMVQGWPLFFPWKSVAEALKKWRNFWFEVWNLKFENLKILKFEIFDLKFENLKSTNWDHKRHSKNIYTGNGRGRGNGKIIFFGFKAEASNKALNNFFFLKASAPSK